MLDNNIKQLILSNKRLFKKGYYTVYLIEEKCVYNFKIVDSYVELEFKNEIDKNGTRAGIYVEKMTSDANPLEGTISNLSPLGEKLISAQVGDILQVETNNYKTTYIVLDDGQ